MRERKRKGGTRPDQDRQPENVASKTKNKPETPPSLPVPLPVKIDALGGIPEAIISHYQSEQDERPSKNLKDNVRIAIEVAAIGAALWLGCLTLGSLREGRKANEISNRNLLMTQRAYLSVGEIGPFGPGIRIRLNNVGHAPAKIISGSFTFERVSMPQNVELEHKAASIAGGATILPGTASDFALMFTLPLIPPEVKSAIDSGAQLVVVDGNVTFDIGFDKSDTIGIHTTYNHETKSWSHINEGLGVDFRALQIPKQ